MMPDYPLYHNFRLAYKTGELLENALESCPGATALVINPRLKWEGDFRGLPVLRQNGVLSCEVLVMPSLVPEHTTSPEEAPAPPTQGPAPVIISSSAPNTPLPPHRPVIYGEKIEARVRELEGEGLGARVIKKVLEAEGSPISLPTVSRKLAAIRQGRFFEEELG